MTYQLLAMDLDGTLLHENLTMSPRVRASLALALERGVRLVLASGRGFPSIRRWAQELGITSPIISYQGAVVTDPRTRRRLLNATFPLALVQEVNDFCRARHLSLTMYADDQIYLEEKQHSDAFFDLWFDLPYHIVPDLPAALPCDPTKFIIVGEEEQIDRLRPEVDARFGDRLQIVRSHRWFLEGMGLGVTKGSALAWLARRLGVAREQTMAIGDSGNDSAMLAWAGLGVAMGNASCEAKAAADVVVGSIHEDGAAEAIERYCLGA
ncbi:MAG: Cof-type HAD-IIB family hydrolase [Anaerolineae bacterium]